MPSSSRRDVVVEGPSEMTLLTYQTRRCHNPKATNNKDPCRHTHTHIYSRRNSPWNLYTRSCPCRMSEIRGRRIPQHYRWGKTSCTCQQTSLVLTFRWDSLAVMDKNKTHDQTWHRTFWHKATAPVWPTGAKNVTGINIAYWGVTRKNSDCVCIADREGIGMFTRTDLTEHNTRGST